MHSAQHKVGTLWCSRINADSFFLLQKMFVSESVSLTFYMLMKYAGVKGPSTLVLTLGTVLGLKYLALNTLARINVYFSNYLGDWYQQFLYLHLIDLDA